MCASQFLELYGLLDIEFAAREEHSNPYLAIQASVTIERLDGGAAAIPLSWKGGQRWELGLSPGFSGTWRHRVAATDPGLNGLPGEFACLPSDRRSGLTVMQHYPAHFAYQDGTPCWLMGDTAWRGFASDQAKVLDRDAALHHVHVRAQQGSSYIHVDLMGGGHRR